MGSPPCPGVGKVSKSEAEGLGAIILSFQRF